ncbi:MAG TPA: haloacid dehalogenase-like hydrolase [Leptospiraceae bacterium]|nr:haloacid dehalogenase-like hydrolase [Leptospiraceae bacterium]
MKYISLLQIGILLFLITCKIDKAGFHPIPEFNAETNARLESFFKETKDYPKRKVAVFDGDGTVLGQAPHYMADECLYEVAKQKPEKKPDVIKKMVTLSNVSIEYVQLRVKFFEGDTVESLRDLGVNCYKAHYNGKVFSPMKSLIQALKQNGFEVWIITASPEAMYQKILSEELQIPITNIVGVKSIVREGKITGEMILPIPQDHGKKEAIETFVQERPLLVGGNSRGDKEMIEYSSNLKLIINPDEYVAEDQTESIAEYARKNNWVIAKVRDVPANDFSYISSKDFNIKKNKTNE